MKSNGTIGPSRSLTLTDSNTYVREIMAKYPMKPENAEVFGRFVLGKAKDVLNNSDS